MVELSTLCEKVRSSISFEQSGYDSANLNICENLYTTGSVATPYYAYQHGIQWRQAKPRVT